MKIRKASAQSGTPQEAVVTVGFRLDAGAWQELTRRAALLDLSPHKLARYYVLEMLGGESERGDLIQGVSQCVDLLQRLRQNVASTALLIATERCSENEARAWVDENLV